MPRGEFLAMCMHLTGTETLQGVLSTGFGDDAQIPAWSKAYVATALMNGDVCGCSDGTAIVFDAQRGITAAEAAVMLGSTETTFYTISVYFGAAGVRRTRYTLPAACIADLTGFFVAALSTKLLF